MGERERQEKERREVWEKETEEGVREIKIKRETGMGKRETGAGVTEKKDR